MNLLEKKVYLHFKDDDIITMGVDTFLYIIFNELKREVINLESIDYIKEFSNSIKKVIELNNDKDYIDLKLSDDENILSLFTYGLSTLSTDISEYYEI